MNGQKKYYLKHRLIGEVEVSREDWIRAERSAGFYPKSGNNDDTATGGFASGDIEGNIVHVTEHESGEESDTLDLAGLRAAAMASTTGDSPLYRQATRPAVIRALLDRLDKVEAIVEVQAKAVPIDVELIAITYPTSHPIDRHLIGAFGEALAARAENPPLLVFLPDGAKIESIDEKEMAMRGWIKKPRTLQ